MVDAARSSVLDGIGIEADAVKGQADPLKTSTR
jgi:hypothetical protein